MIIKAIFIVIVSYHSGRLFRLIDSIMITNAVREFPLIIEKKVTHRNARESVTYIRKMENSVIR